MDNFVTVWVVCVTEYLDEDDEWPEEYNEYFKTEEAAKAHTEECVKEYGCLADYHEVKLDLSCEYDLQIYNKAY